VKWLELERKRVRMLDKKRREAGEVVRAWKEEG